MMDTVLVANRGEVARRVFRACEQMGLDTVAVYSDADAGTPFVEEADVAVRIGPARSADSYLDQQAILEAAEQTGADAVHPGYGFLAENHNVAQRVIDAGLTWVGPDPDTMELMADKVAARELAIENDVPVSPGSEGVVEDVSRARKIAEDVGFPVMLKARAGGGGMGMRVAEDPHGLETAFEEASTQAEAAFGDGALFVEKFVEDPRHVEVQILGGPEADIVHLGERECSIQRRHQKLVEEAPSPALDAQTRDELGQMAVRLAEAADYVNAGTLEFLYEDGNFYFNEVNARLQVEHPVTELVTGIDLVREQLRVAQGRSPSFSQDEVTFDGHAIEIRVNAEDPYDEFTPRFGTVKRFEPPTGEHLRVDHGLCEGFSVPAEYDSLLAKFIAWGPTRREATQRLEEAVNTASIGCTTNLPLHRRILAHDQFVEGDLSTNFLTETGIVDALADEGEKLAETARRRAAAITAALAVGADGGIGTTYHRQSRPARVDGGDDA
jgi:acetyl-CoA carboxylase biotin carboxylase subunit